MMLHSISFSDDDFAKVSQYARQNVGIFLDKSKKDILMARISRRMGEVSVDVFDDYFRDLRSGRNQKEQDVFISLLTTNITSFFREPHHFETLQHKIREQTSSSQSDGVINIWSAGCSTGQEAYSISLAVANEVNITDRGRVNILASDVDSQVLKTAEKGVYGEGEASNLSGGVRSQLFESPKDGSPLLTVRQKYRDMIGFKKLNLVDLPNDPVGLDYIFCRNVVIYFDRETQSRLWAEFHRRLKVGGVLFIGQAERLCDGFENKFMKIGRTTYQKRAEG